jgi:hypothetical protein
MKIEGEVKRVGNSGDTLKVEMRARSKRDAFWRLDGDCYFEVACTDKAKKAYHVGRKVTIEIKTT